MNATERRAEIFNLLQKDGSADLNELAEKLAVSSMTVRRDLQIFEHQGLVTIDYGRAYLDRNVSHEPSFTVKAGHMVNEKLRIGKAAADMVEDGDTILIDCGTTTLQMLKYLAGKRVTVITNSWPAIHHVSGNPRLRLVLLPGEYNEISAGVFGDMTVEYLKMIHADRVFIGTHGCTATEGATVPETWDAAVKRALFSAARKRFLLADATKFGIVNLMSHAMLSDFDCVITDSSMEEEAREEMKKNCRQMIFA